mmetsp:Transcript_125454/g.217534  ORF Transcript_125454/g.217534 Transcript_125454/m.217534 type:complete len:98 (-) Transcript_125454:918-1211(-)
MTLKVGPLYICLEDLRVYFGAKRNGKQTSPELPVLGQAPTVLLMAPFHALVSHEGLPSSSLSIGGRAIFLSYWAVAVITLTLHLEMDRKPPRTVVQS